MESVYRRWETSARRKCAWSERCHAPCPESAKGCYPVIAHELTAVGVAQGENEAMPVVRVILREGQEKVYHEAHASIHTPDRTLRITRNQDSIAEFQS